MAEEPLIEHQRDLQEMLNQIQFLMERQKLVSQLLKKEKGSNELLQTLLEKQQNTELQQYLRRLHPADIAYVLESLPMAKREEVWRSVDKNSYGEILLELSDAVRERIIPFIQNDDIAQIARKLDSDEIADLFPDLPSDIANDLMDSLQQEERQQVHSALSFPDGSVGALMDFEMITVKEDNSLGDVIDILRKRGEMPSQSNMLFVVGVNKELIGGLEINELLINDSKLLVCDVISQGIPTFHTNDEAKEAAQAFERYDLISAPVINAHNHLVGCLHIDAVVDFINESSQREILSKSGLSEEEDLFAPVLQSGKNRWPWLGLNLVTAFIASRVIGIFEETIVHIVALATLMPIVASVGGNTGNQTIALIIRGLALNQISSANFYRLLFKELRISILNGVIWGAVVGVFAFVFYQQWQLALVMFAAMVINLIIASLAGVFIPLILKGMGRDPVMGGSVILTAITDSMGFFIFLGLASLFLVNKI